MQGSGFGQERPLHGRKPVGKAVGRPLSVSPASPPGVRGAPRGSAAGAHTRWCTEDRTSRPPVGPGTTARAKAPHRRGHDGIALRILARRLTRHLRGAIEKGADLRPCVSSPLVHVDHHGGHDRPKHPCSDLTPGEKYVPRSGSCHVRRDCIWPGLCPGCYSKAARRIRIAGGSPACNRRWPYSLCGTCQAG